MPNHPAFLIIHDSDSPGGNAHLIDRMHREERGWGMIGYHYVILNGHGGDDSWGRNPYDVTKDGKLEKGRPDDVIGAHCLGFNSNSLGICLIGNSPDQISLAQMNTLVLLCAQLMERYSIPADRVIGHRETDSGRSAGKTDPRIDMDKLRQSLSVAHQSA